MSLLRSTLDWGPLVAEDGRRAAIMTVPGCTGKGERMSGHNRGIGRILKLARSKSGLTQEQLADRLHVSTSLIAKFETNRLIPKQDTARQLDAAMDSGTAIQEEAAEVRSQFGAMEFIRHWLEYEQQAGMIRSFNPLVVPGLLQTEAYAHAILSEAGTRVPDIDESVSDRLERAGILRREDNPCRLVAVVDEAVLRRPVGGPKVMADQLHAIAQACSLPTISVAVVPASVGSPFTG